MKIRKEQAWATAGFIADFIKHRLPETTKEQLVDFRAHLNMDLQGLPEQYAGDICIDYAYPSIFENALKEAGLVVSPIGFFPVKSLIAFTSGGAVALGWSLPGFGAPEQVLYQP